MKTIRVLAALVAVGLAISMPGASDAQQLRGCRSTPLTNPPRTEFRCASGLVIEAEASAEVAIVSGGIGASPEAVELTGRALFIDIAPRRGRFQILTPHAIASVRGTVYAVDVAPGATAVFVSEGSVAVARRDGSSPVELGPGEGVDVAPGRALTVRRWPQERVARLLARFGR